MSNGRQWNSTRAAIEKERTLSHYTRLRQVCLVAHDLEKTVDELCSVFDIRVCHRDPNVAKYGLVNALMPVGTSFIEVVSPAIPGPSTAAGRYLERRGGDGGYMVINDCDDVARFRTRAQQLGIRIVEDRTYEGKANLLQLHPADTGGAILEFDHHVGGEQVDGAYHWAGTDWRRFACTTRVNGIEGVAMQSAKPGRIAKKWGSVYGKRAILGTGGCALALDNGSLLFGFAPAGEDDAISAMFIVASDRAVIVREATARGLPVTKDERSIQICGVWFNLRDG